MLAPLSWLSEYAPFGVDPLDRATVGALGEVLDSLGLVIEGIEFVGEGLDDVVLARVTSIRPIEGADRIRLVVADRGDGEPLEIVCGAMNFAEGDVVPLAPVGATLPGGFRIERRKMRGVVSNGMLCSGRELGLSDDQAGLMILASPGSAHAPLADGVVLGTALGDFLGLEPDAIFDVGVEPNRPDALSIVGIAHDLAAKLGLAFAPPEPKVERSGPDASTLASVETTAPLFCDRIAGRVLTGVQVTVSPPVVRRRLELSGMRPINSVVDASNYVMLELGQPTHPYDLERLGGRGISVRLARSGEELVTLDGQTRTLGLARNPAGELVELAELVITDAKGRAVGLAGVMGGAESEIGPETTEVLLEIAHFEPVIVGRQAARAGIRTEASQRFWRGTDPDGIDRAADRFCELVVAAQLAAGLAAPSVAPGTLDDDLRAPADPPIKLRTARVGALLGVELGRSEIAALLEPLGFGVAVDREDLLVTVPGYRPDVTLEVDLIEEVARHHGYENIPRTTRRSGRPGRLSERQRRRRTLLEVLVGFGCDEAWTPSIVEPEFEEVLGPDGTFVEVTNPIVAPENVLRTRLLPGLLGALRRNEGHRNGAIRLFEIGRVFASAGDLDERPTEREQLGALLAFEGDGADRAVQLLRRILDRLRIDPAAVAMVPVGDLDDPARDGCHPTRSAYIVDTAAGRDAEGVIGVVGEVDPDVLDAFGNEQRRVGWLSLDLDLFLALRLRSTLALPVSGFPSSDLDLAFVLDDDVPAERLRSEIADAAGPLLESLVLVDVYRGPSVAAGTRSLAFRLRLSALDHTLSTEEIQTARLGVITAVEERLPARLR